MAISKPIINRPIIPFDAESDNEITIKFSYDGNQFIKVLLTIVDYNNESMVYHQKTYITSALRVIAPQNTLGVSNGNRYKMSITVIDVDEQSSLPSDYVDFYCFSEPTFEFNPAIPSVYTEQIINLSLNYQSEDEPLSSYQYFVYKDNILINKSNTFFVGEDGTLQSYRWEDANNGETYTFRADGETKNGMIVSTESTVKFEYDEPEKKNTVVIENLYCDGYLRINVNIKDVPYEINGNNYDLVDGTLIIKDDTILTYESHNMIQENEPFTIMIDAVKLPVKNNFFQINDNMVFSVVGIGDDYYIVFKNGLYTINEKLEFYNYPINYDESNNTINLTNSNMLIVLTREQNGFYEINISPN